MTDANKQTPTTNFSSEENVYIYRTNSAAIRKMLARLSEAAEKDFDATFGHLRGDCIDHLNVGWLCEHGRMLAEFSDRVFCEGEHAEGALEPEA